MKKFILLFLISFNLYADTATVNFIPPTEREDNTPLPASEIGGYEVLDELGAKAIPNLPANATSFTETLTTGTYKRFLVTVDTDGRKSVLTPEISVVIPASPKPPTVTGIVVVP